MALYEDPEQHERRALAQMMPSFAGRRVLEIGCGDGRVTRLFAGAAASVLAIDPKPEAIAALRAQMPTVDARNIGIDKLELSPHSVDIVIFSWSL